MTAILDTSVIVRYLTGDDPDMTVMAKAVIEGNEPLVVPPVVLAEAAFVLLSTYRVGRARVVESLVQFVNRPNVSVEGADKALAVQALEMCAPSGRISVADALTWMSAVGSAIRVVYTFDRRFPDEGVELRYGP